MKIEKAVVNSLNHPFPYLDKFRSRLLHVGIILAFSIFFMIVFEPFNATQWLKFEDWRSWIGLAGFGISGSVIIAISQLFFRSIIKIKTFRIKHFILWVSLELLFATLFLAMIYGETQNPFFTELKATFKYAALVSLLPYSFSLLILAFIHQRKEKNNRGRLSPDQMDLISFKDERDQVKFSVNRKDILYLESTDNYITVFFLNDNTVSKHMVRTSLKKLEDTDISIGLVRCHRSFMVNLENVMWMKKEGRNFVIKIKQIGSLIPVSRSYAPHFKSLIQS